MFRPSSNEAHEMAVHATGVALFDQWTALWNGDLALAGEILADRFVLRYAQPETEPMDTVHRPDQLAVLIAQWRELRHNPVFRAEGRAIVEVNAGAASGIVVRPYSSTFALPGLEPHTISGIDWLQFVDGRIVQVLSASGGREGRSFRLGDTTAS